MLQSPRTRRRAERVHDEALDAAATHSCTAVRDRHAAHAQHGVAVQPKERLWLSHTSEARAAEAGGAAHPVQVERGTAHGVNTAHLKAFHWAASRWAFHPTGRGKTLTKQRSRGGEALGAHRATVRRLTA